MMYKRHLNQINLLDEPEYFGGIALDPDNEWVKLAKLIPWHQFEEEYASSFPSGTGQPACSFRMALGSLLIKERYQFSDEETVAHITMNPYLQYFIGLEAFTQKSPFDQSMMTRFRKRISTKTLQEVMTSSGERQKRRMMTVTVIAGQRRKQRNSDSGCDLRTSKHSLSDRWVTLE